MTTLPFSGYSMFPALRPGDRLVVRKIASSNVQVGDILAFHANRQLIVHRIIKVLPDREFLTKGDAMAAPDRQTVRVGAAVGKVILVLRGRRLIPFASGYRERFKRPYAWLSSRNLTRGVVKETVKRVVFKDLARRFARRSVNRQKTRKWLCDLVCGKMPVYPRAMETNVLETAAVQEGVAGYLYPLLQQIGAPADTLAVFKRHYLTIAARNLTGLAGIARLEDDLRKARMQMIFLKGASLAESVYPRPGLRMMEDIDILIRPEDQKRFTALLERHGYRVDPGRAHCFFKGHTCLDLHTDALNRDRIEARKWLFPAGMGPIWDRAVPWQAGVRQIRRPADTDNLLLLVQHALKHGCARLIWLIDIWLILKDRPPGFWRKLYDRAVQLYQMRALYQVLFLLEREFGLEVPAPFEAPAGQVPWLAQQLLLLREDGRVDAYTGILLPLLSISGCRQRLAFVIENTFLKESTARREFGNSFATRPAGFYLARLGVSLKLALFFCYRLGTALFRQRSL